MSDLNAQDMELKQLVAEIQGARPNPKKLEALLEKYEKEFGKEAEQRVQEIIAETTERAWSDIAERRKNNDIQGVLDTLWTSFEKVGGEFTVKRTEDSAQIHCTKCPIADTYLKIGKPQYGLLFHCSTDPYIVAGFNPEMEFRITKRLMSGNECCNHYYQLKQHH
ncbi:MAG: L-2-amino-thiazoline-4-carboxylic acid hydrolase [Candidatus Thorarchaeota archaeon]